MKKIKKGDLLILQGNESKELYYTGVLDSYTWNERPCIFLAEDLKNKNTYSRFSQDFIEACGYCIN